MTVGRQDAHYIVHASELLLSNHNDIYIRNNKDVLIEYGLTGEDFGEYPIQEAEEATKAFEFALPDREKSLVGPEVINNWSFGFARFSSVPYRLLKYVLVYCPHLQHFNLYCLRTRYDIRLSSSSQNVWSRAHIDKSGPSCTSQDSIKHVKSENFASDQEYLDLIASNLPNMKTITYADRSHISRYDTFQSAGLKFNLTAFPKLKTFHMNTEV